MKSTALGAFAIATALGLAACGSHANPPAQVPQAGPSIMKPMDVGGGPSGTRLNVLLGDAAPNISGKNLKRLDLGIREIDAIEDGQVTVLASYDEPRIVNVLAHQDDNGESVASANVVHNDYQQLRVVVDLASSTAKFEGERPAPVNFLVNVASASSSAAGVSTVTTSDGPGAVDMIVTQPFSIPDEHTNAVRVDFNAFESLALDTAGNVLARPTLFVAPVDDMGKITGRVLGPNGSPVSNATVVAVAADGSTANTDWTNDKGRFTIGTLRSGTYKLVIYNRYTTAAGRVLMTTGESATNASVQSFTGPTVTVRGGQTTAVGSIAD